MMIIINAAKYDNGHENVNGERRQLKMRVSREQVVQNRSRILIEAGRLFREKGFDAVSVSEVMKAAGLTHGAFYGHFKSKDDLIAQVIEDAASSQSDTDDLCAFIDNYLSTPHRDHSELGCPTAALAGLMRNQAPEARAAMAQRLAGQIDQLADAMPGADRAERRRAAIGSWAALIGAVILARSIDDATLSNDLLAETKAWIDAKREPEPSVPKEKGRAA